jgi:hypothetical protein
VDDLTGPGEPVENGYRFEERATTTGRFACSIAIAQFALDPDADDTAALKLVRMRPATQALWADRFQHLPEIREVVFLRPDDSPRAPRDVEHLRSVARRFGARLLLAYTSNQYGLNSTQVYGRLFDVSTGTALAAMHASRMIRDDDGMEASPINLVGDHRDVDAHYQAGRAFERIALDCVAALIDADSPSATPEPSRWRSERPGERLQPAPFRQY